MMTGPAAEACPGCGDTTGVHPVPGLSPRVRAWSCPACRTDWAITVANPRPWLDQLTATVELAAARSMLRQVIALADEAPALPDDQLRLRLRALAVRGTPRSHALPRSPAGRWSSEAPDSAPSGQPVPYSADAEHADSQEVAGDE
jgi:hypothetical protein